MPDHSISCAARGQCGAAALIVTLMLFFAMVMTAVFVNRNLLVEQHSAVNHAGATQAFEAAEAGLEWALAQLNNPQRLGADCTLSTAADASAFRARYLRADTRSGRFTPAEWSAAGVVRPLQASCVRGVDGWACSCPRDAEPSLSMASGSDAAPGFSIQFAAAERPGTVRIVSTGCSRAASLCIADDSQRNQAHARVEATVALVPALRTPPAATLTTRGAVASTAAFSAHNTDPESGLAIHAGGTIAAAAARLTAPAGASLDEALLPNDAALASSTPARFFADHFGIGKADWSAQPGVTRIDCRTACVATLLRAIDAAGTPPLIWIDGDLDLDGPVAIGTPERPAALVVSGVLRLGGAVRFHGVLHAGVVTWTTTPDTGALLRGALLSEAGYGGDGTPALIYDRAVLATLQRASGSFVRVGGSWRDF